MNTQELKNKLPHGSGIDADWVVEDKGRYWKCSNSFHCMNDEGFYIGWQDFSVIISKKDIGNFRLHFHGYRYLAERYMLRDYLEDVIHYCLCDEG